MDHISNLATAENCHLSSKPSLQPSESKSVCAESENAPPRLLAENVVTRVWERMTAIYGHKWTAHIGAASTSSGDLTEAARTWQKGLAGVTTTQLGRGFSALIALGNDWPPSLPEFRALCLQAGSAVPSLDETVRILANARSADGSLVDRYRHPLCLAIASGIDMSELRCASTSKAMAIVGPVYKRFLASGWAEWPVHAHDRPKALGVSKTSSRDVAMQAIERMRGALVGSGV